MMLIYYTVMTECCAATHVEQIEAVLLANYPVSRAQLDAPLDLHRAQGRKRGQCKEETRRLS